VADRVRDRALGRFGGIASVNVNAHAHLGDTAHTCHWVPAFVRGYQSLKICIMPPKSSYSRVPPCVCDDREPHLWGWDGRVYKVDFSNGESGIFFESELDT